MTHDAQECTKLEFHVRNQEKTGNTFYLRLSALTVAQAEAQQEGKEASPPPVAAKAESPATPQSKESTRVATPTPVAKKVAEADVRPQARSPQVAALRDSQELKRMGSRSGELSLVRGGADKDGLIGEEEPTGYVLQVEVFGVEEVGAEIADQLREVRPSSLIYACAVMHVHVLVREC
jgi:hypothetical protein